MARRQRRTFSPEQKANAVRLVDQVGNLSKVARDLDLHPSVLSDWCQKAKIDAGKGPVGALTTAERAELTRLRRENHTLQMERDFLRKAAAFFARDPDGSSK